jgi:CheY-like chemotaxis protein
VLIVDDNRDAAELLGELVVLMGHEAIVAHDGEAALKRAEENGPHVALLDIGLPTIDGYELARRLHRLPGLQSTPLIAITGYGRHEDVERARKAGFAHHLLKPVAFEVLAALLPTLV